MTPDEFRKAGYAVVDFIADYRERIAERPVMAQTAPGAIKASLPASPPSDPESFEQILADVDRLVLPGLTHWQHPSFFGYFPGNSLLSSVLGDYVSTGLGVLGLAWQSSPALTEVEEVVDRLDAADGRTARRLARRDSGHRLHQHADRAASARANGRRASA